MRPKMSVFTLLGYEILVIPYLKGGVKSIVMGLSAPMGVNSTW